jgi:hypothetical protein
MHAAADMHVCCVTAAAAGTGPRAQGAGGLEQQHGAADLNTAAQTE